MCQAHEVAGPNHPNTVRISCTDELLQVPHKVAGECVQGAGQMKVCVLLIARVCQSHSTLRLPMCYECLLALSNPCWTLPVGCSLVHRGRIESTINLYPAKGKAMAMSAATTSLEWPD